VLTLADTDMQTLKTACISKDRLGQWTDQQVFRLVLDPTTLRLEPLPATSPPSRAAWQPEVSFVNCKTSDFPDSVGFESGGDDDDEQREDDDPRSRTVRPAGHAGKGWVPIDRDLLFGSIYFENREYENIYRLLDLAQLAEFRDREARMHGSRRRVSLTRGQYVTALRFLAKRWGVSASTVKQFLQDAETEGLLEVNSQRDGTIITVKFYGAMGGRDDD